MIDHQVVDVLVLTLLNLMDLDFHAQGQLLVKLTHLVLVNSDQIDLVAFQGLLQLLNLLLLAFGEALDLADVGLVGLLEVLFVLAFGVTVLRLGLLVVVILGLHDFATLVLDCVHSLTVLILVVLYLLQMGNHKRVVRVFLLLHLRVEILDLGLELLDLLPGVLIEVVDHVLLNLQGVTLHLGVLEFFAQIENGDLELLAPHGHELVFRLGLFFLALLPLSLLFLTGHWLGVSTFRN